MCVRGVLLWFFVAVGAEGVCDWLFLFFYVE